jgi:hypothetical protein
VAPLKIDEDVRVAQRSAVPPAKCCTYTSRLTYRRLRETQGFGRPKIGIWQSNLANLGGCCYQTQWQAEYWRFDSLKWLIAIHPNIWSLAGDSGRCQGRLSRF